MKKALLLTGLALLALVQMSAYWSEHLYNTAVNKLSDPGDRIRVLERAAGFFPWNGRIYFELGKASFEQGSEALENAAVRDAAFRKSVGSFLKSLRYDPGSVAAHFHFAQTLQYMGFLQLPTPYRAFDEYRNAAALTGHNSQIFFEVGRLLFSRWESLSPSEKDFTRDILKKTLAGKDREKLMSILEVWYLHAQDPAVIEAIMPDDPAMIRAYAAFLGEKGLPLESRHRALAKAELLDFEKAKRDLEQGEREYEYFQSEEAPGRFASCLAALKSVVFYQALSGESLIDPAEFAGVRKAATLLLVKAQIDRTRTLDDPDGLIASYLDMEDQTAALGEFEKFLRDRGLLENPGEVAGLAKDLDVLALRLTLDFKQNRYRDITRTSEQLRGSVLIIPDSAKPAYVRILRLVGDSYLKLDYIYEAERHFRRALEMDPASLETLLRLLSCYERLNDDRQAREVRKAVEALLTPSDIDLEGRLVRKGETSAIRLVSEGGPETCRLEFEMRGADRRPLLTAVYNDKVVWEGYAEDGGFDCAVTSRPGANTLAVTAVNEGVALLRLVRAPREGS